MLVRLLSQLLGPSVRPYEQQTEVDQQSANLALYDLTFCPYSFEVRLTIKRLGLKIDIRNINHPQWGKELIQGGGKHQAPCLRIDNGEQGVQWLYESRAIILYLQQQFS